MFLNQGDFMATARKIKGKDQYVVQQFIGMVDGKRKYKRFYGSTKKEAELAALQYKIPSGQFTFKDAYEKFISDRSAVMSPSTVLGYGSIYKYHLTRLENIPVDNIDAKMVQQFVSSISAKRSPKTVRNIYALLTAVLKYNGVSTNFDVRLPQKSKNEIVIPSDADVLKMIDTDDSNIKMAIYLGAFCGLRRGEVCALDNVTGNEITVDKSQSRSPSGGFVIKPPKSTSGHRTIQIPNFVADLLRGQLQAYGKAVPWNIDQLTKHFSTHLKQKGIKHYRFHDLRHYLCSTMIHQNMPLLYIAKYLGHNDTGMVQSVYGHLQKDQNAKMIDRVSGYFEAMQH